LATKEKMIDPFSRRI